MYVFLYIYFHCLNVSHLHFKHTLALSLYLCVYIITVCLYFCQYLMPFENGEVHKRELWPLFPVKPVATSSKLSTHHGGRFGLIRKGKMVLTLCLHLLFLNKNSRFTPLTVKFRSSFFHLCMSLHLILGFGGTKKIHCCSLSNLNFFFLSFQRPQLYFQVSCLEHLKSHPSFAHTLQIMFIS